VPVQVGGGIRTRERIEGYLDAGVARVIIGTLAIEQPVLTADLCQRFPDRIAVIHGPRRFTYAEFHARSRRLASALAARGVGEGDTVSVMLTAQELIAFARENLPHFAVPRAVVFGPLPTTATGKIQKYELRRRAREL